MNEKIKEFLKWYCESKGYGTEEDDLTEALFENEEEVYSGDIEEFRWWHTYTIIKKFIKEDGSPIFIGYEEARTNRDESARECGWEFCPDTIAEYEPIEVKVTQYKIKEG